MTKRDKVRRSIKSHLSHLVSLGVHFVNENFLELSQVRSFRLQREREREARRREREGRWRERFNLDRDLRAGIALSPHPVRSR